MMYKICPVVQSILLLIWCEAAPTVKLSNRGKPSVDTSPIITSSESILVIYTNHRFVVGC